MPPVLAQDDSLHGAPDSLLMIQQEEMPGKNLMYTFWMVKYKWHEIVSQLLLCTWQIKIS